MCDVVWNVGDMNGTRRNGFIPAGADTAHQPYQRNDRKPSDDVR